ncbi:MAG TPA: prepilin-type N-terminal cleavage/methylation domain-containing protein, partial [Candidatus Saccharimonadales bacterium]|nr:prepilin-type N-terminal cleavage/methylation domain-containing protein [Candidatus Saccharimonadales bacterium]
HKQAGFTIIEVMLYLGVAAMLFLIAFWGTEGQVNQFRYSDAARNLNSYIQEQYNSVQSGTNPREATETCTATGAQPPSFGTGSPNPTGGNADECILLGKLVQFTPGSSTVNVYYVVGYNAPFTSLTGDDLTDIKNSQPTISPIDATTTNISGGLTFYQPGSVPPSGLSESFAFLRSPSSSNILTFAFNNVDINNGNLSPGASYTIPPAVIGNSLDTNDAGYCLYFGAVPEKYSMIQLGNNTQGGSINISYNPNPNTQCVQ